MKQIEFDTEEEMEQSFAENDYKFHKFVVESALKNIDSKKEEIKIMSILTKDTNTIFDIILEPEFMVETFETNLPIMERYEDYERCQKIVNAIDYLKSKS